MGERTVRRTNVSIILPSFLISMVKKARSKKVNCSLSQHDGKINIVISMSIRSGYLIELFYFIFETPIVLFSLCNASCI